MFNPCKIPFASEAGIVVEQLDCFSRRFVTSPERQRRAVASRRWRSGLVVLAACRHHRPRLRAAARGPGAGASCRLRPGRGVEAAYRHVHKHVRPLGRDRTRHHDLELVERLIRFGTLLLAVGDVCGKLE
ncbi:MAG TPA: hypothetical protein VMF69_09870 [Gemmataceae bacterium]|nr:hypothetical protein [Gemmataceae bacterium]